MTRGAIGDRATCAVGVAHAAGADAVGALAVRVHLGGRWAEGRLGPRHGVAGAGISARGEPGAATDRNCDSQKRAETHPQPVGQQARLFER
jgi:hypothetical protein